MRRGLGILLVAVLASACAQPAEVLVEPGPAPTDDGAAPELAWEQLDQVEAVLPDRAAAALLDDPGAVMAAWDDHGFDGAPPTVDFDDHVVLLLGQPDDGCPDDLRRLEVVDGDLEVAWLPPPGGCIQPLIFRLHAIRVHRGVLAEGFDYGLAPPYDGDLEPVTIELPHYTGDAPPAPEPPQAMTEAELDAVFDDHPVVRCGPEHDVLDLGPSEEQEDGAPTGPVASIEAANAVLSGVGIDIERDVVPFMDRSTGGRLAYFVSEADAATVEDVFAAEFGDQAPGLRISPWAPGAVRDAQEALHALMGGEWPGAIMESTGGPGPVQLGMVDPTRDALDAVAATVDPGLVCVQPILSGVSPTTDAAATDDGR